MVAVAVILGFGSEGGSVRVKEIGGVFHPSLCSEPPYVTQGLSVPGEFSGTF